MLRALPLLFACLGLGACDRAGAPDDAGVCWRAELGDGHAPRFSPLAHGVRDLDTCAVLLEAARLQGGANADGAFQGYFIFVDADGMSSAKHPDSFRYPIFQPPQRAALDRDLRRLMRTHGGRLPDAADLSLEWK